MISSKIKTALVITFLILLTPSAGVCDTFSFAVICDPHLDGRAAPKNGLEEAVKWITANKESKGIKFVFIVGDIGWGWSGGKRNIITAKEILDSLNAADTPYIPLPGDNEIEYGGEKDFNDIFAGQYKYLASICENWQKSPAAVGQMYLQNFSFDYKGCHFTCPDFISRKTKRNGDIFDMVGGSWQWFKNDIKSCAKPKQKNIVIFTHIGIFRAGVFFADDNLFTDSDLSKIRGFLAGYNDYIDSNYAGHVHLTMNWEVRDNSLNPLYTVRMTANLTNNDLLNNGHKLTIRLVRVDTAGPAISYTQEIETLEIPAPAQK